MKIKIFLFMIATSFFWFSHYAYVPELSTYAEDLGASYKMIGIITGSYGFMQLLLRIPLGILSDRLNKRKIFIELGMFITVISCLVTFLFPSVFSLLMTRILAGIAACTWVLFTVLFSSYFKSDESTKAIGLISGSNAAGQLIGMLLGGFISLNFGTRYLYLLGAIGGTIGLILSFLINENRNIHRVPLKLKELFRIALEPSLIKVSILGILSQVITFGTTLGFVPIVARQLGAGSLELSWITAINILPGIWMPAITGTFLLKKWGESRTLIYGFILCSLIAVIIPFVPFLWLLMMVQFLAGIGRSIVFPLLMGLCIRNVEDNKRATAMGFFQAVYGVGMVMGPIILGAIGDYLGLTLGFVVTGLIGVLSVVMILRYKIV